MIFLLGGYDLEMLAIKELLDSKGIRYYDKSLSWGAKLSQYKEFFNDKDYFYAIELEEDVQPPKYYKLIDHHGKHSDKQSSLEQIAKILNISLSREQKLIAANDSHYIKGLQERGATQEEINHIRKLDKRVQGITQEDEELAKKSLNNSPYVYAHTDKFSAISDLLIEQYSQYIIYNDTTLSFYGYKITDIIDWLHTKEIQEDAYYYGGGKFGFVGIKNNVLSRKKIIELLTEFKK